MATLEAWVGGEPARITIALSTHQLLNPSPYSQMNTPKTMG